MPFNPVDIDGSWDLLERHLNASGRTGVPIWIRKLNIDEPRKAAIEVIVCAVDASTMKSSIDPDFRCTLRPREVLVFLRNNYFAPICVAVEAVIRGSQATWEIEPNSARRCPEKLCLPARKGGILWSVRLPQHVILRGVPASCGDKQKDMVTVDVSIAFDEPFEHDRIDKICRRKNRPRIIASDPHVIGSVACDFPL